MNVLKLLSSNNFIVYQKSVAKKVGIEAAILIGELCSLQQYWNEKNNSEDNVYFFISREKVIDDTCLSLYALKQALALLKKLNIFEIKYDGMPRRAFYRINNDMLTNLFDTRPTSRVEIEPTSEVEIEPTSEVEIEPTYNKNIFEKETNNNNTSKDRDNSSSSNQLIINTIICYLNQKCGTSYLPTSKNTIKHITARLNEGFKPEDFRIVIDKKYKDWFKDSKMKIYLRPDTLFGTKFESYLNQPKIKTTEDYLEEWLNKEEKEEQKENEFNMFN